jgi:hypothetical protein
MISDQSQLIALQPARLSRSISLTDSHHDNPSQPLSADFPPAKLELFAPDFFDLSPAVSSALSSLCTQFGIALHLTSTTPERTMDYFGKRNDVVDFGGEANYENVQWFKDPPPPRTVRSFFALCPLMTPAANLYPPGSPHHKHLPRLLLIHPPPTIVHPPM